MLRASQRTTTIFCPLSNCLATVLASRPRRWPLPSIVIYVTADVRNDVPKSPSQPLVLSQSYCWRRKAEVTAERSNLRLARRSTSCPASRGDEKTNIEKVVESSTFDLVEEGCRFVVEIVVVETIRRSKLWGFLFLAWIASRLGRIQG